jgi:hypothetical protein
MFETFGNEHRRSFVPRFSSLPAFALLGRFDTLCLDRNLRFARFWTPALCAVSPE